MKLKWPWFGAKRAIPSPGGFAMMNLPPAVSSPRDYRTFSEEGYKKNVVAYQCIERIGNAMSAVPLCLKRKQKKGAVDVEEHPVLDILFRPNPMQSYQAFVKSAVGYFMISGNNFIHAVGPSETKPPTQLWNLRPDRMSIKPGPFMMPTEFIYDPGSGRKMHCQVDQLDGSSAIMHMKTFNPVNDCWGMSPVEAAAFSVDQLNAQGKWNLALLQNSARPSGALIVKGNNGEGMELTENQRSHLKQEIDLQYANSRSTGRPMLLENGMDWKEMGINPKDMDWIQGKNTTSRDICLAFSVPPQLMGIPGDNTYSNYEQAKLAFYMDTVIPLLRMWEDHLNYWLLPAFDDSGELYLEANLNKVEALEPVRQAKWKQIDEADFLTYNEKREQLGYGRYKQDAADAADRLFIPMGQVPIEDAAAEVEPTSDEVTDTEDYEDPDEDEETEEPTEGDSDEGDEDPADDDGGKRRLVAFIEGKAVNLNSKRARERYRRTIIKKRDRMGRTFETQLRAAFAAQGKAVAEAVDGITIDLAEYTVDLAVDQNSKQLETVIRSNITRVMKSFGVDVLAMAKLHQHNPETKDAQTRFDSFLDDYVSRHTAEAITKINRTTKRRVVRELRKGFRESFQEGATPQEMQEMVMSTYKGFTPARAHTIVVTETGIAQNEAQRKAAEALKIDGLQKVWISEMVERSRHNHMAMHEIAVDLKESFLVPSAESGSDTMVGPGDPSAPADQIINCHCVTVFETRNTRQQGDE